VCLAPHVRASVNTVASHRGRHPRPRLRPRQRIHSVHRRRPLFHPFRRPVSQRSLTV